jgi:hypothetical protein
MPRCGLEPQILNDSKNPIAKTDEPDFILIAKSGSIHGDIPFIISMASIVPVELLMDSEGGDGR